MLQKNIDRLEATHDYRMMQIALGSTTSEGVTKLSDSLKKTIGVIVEYDRDRMAVETMLEEKLDRDGLNKLRGKGKLR